MDKNRATARAAASLFHAAPGQLPANYEELAKRATDLEKVKQTADEQRVAEENARAKVVAAVVWRWDRAMRRAFKGVMPSPERHRMMRLAYAEREARGEA